MNANIRHARPDDAPALVELIRELAIFEKLEEQAQATPEALREHLFGPRTYAEALMAEVDGQPIGFALVFHTFSTFRGQPGLYLEDLFVQPDYRGQGIGKALLAAVAGIAVDRGCGRLEWTALDWNDPAIAFYRSQGAAALDEWTVFRMEGADLEQLAARSPLPTREGDAG